MIVYMTMLGPPVGVFMVVWGMDVGPLPITKSKNGFGFAPAMGLMVQCANLVQTDMSLDLNQRLCGLLMV